MIVCLLTWEGDIAKTIALLEWIGELGGCRNHDLVLVADAGTPFDLASRALELGRVHFKTAKIITNKQSVKGWPAGCWSLFQTAIKHAKESFLILEPDAIPLKAGWLDQIAEAYARCGKPFLGHIYDCKQPFLPEQLMSGISVYPENMIDWFPPIEEPQHWDVYGAGIMVANGADTPLIRHYFGQKDLPPFFVREKHPNSPANALTMDVIHPACVLWHRDKTHSLIGLLGGKQTPKTDQSLLVVLPFCHKDGERMYRTIFWMQELGGCEEHDALLSYEQDTPYPMLQVIRHIAHKTFRSVEETSYPHPEPGEAAQTMAWRHVAIHVSQKPRPWLWNEADAIPLQPDWLQVLEHAYHQHGKPFAGPRVQGMDHFNGCMIYAGNTPDLLPQTMAAKHCIWDIYSGAEMAPHAVDIGHLHFHAWGMIGNNLHSFAGTEPSFPNEQSLRLIPSTAVVLHRCKDGSLIQRLREQRR